MSIPSIGTTLPFHQGPGAGAMASTTKAVTGNSGSSPETASGANGLAATTNNANQVSSGKETLKSAIDNIEAYIKPLNNNIEFSINDEIGQVVVKVVDSETKEIILQIPSEEMIAIAKALDKIQGLLIKQKA